MNKTFRHIILTRFNLQYEKNSTIHIQPEWLETRFFLFEKYCLPSLQAQTCKNFVWILLADEQTPQVYKDKLLSYQESMPEIQVLFCPFYTDCNILYRKVGEQYIEGYTYLLSTRLDNDDMLASNFVEKVQKVLMQPHSVPCILTFETGIQYFAKEHIALKYRYKQNHFLTFLEEKSHIQTALGMDHTKVPKDMLLSIDEDDLWCEVVHGTNLCNGYMLGVKYIFLTRPTGMYPIDFPRTQGIRHLCFHIRQWWLKRQAQAKRQAKRFIRKWYSK